MATWNELVDVSVLSGSVSVSAGVDFGTVLYLADEGDVHTANFTDRYKVYETLAALLDDSGLVGDGKLFPADGAIVAAGQAFWSQAKQGGPLVIGRKDSGDADWGAAFNAVFAEYTDFYLVTAHTDVEYDSATTSWTGVATAISDLATAVAAAERLYFSLTGDDSASAPASNSRHVPIHHNVWADEVNYWLEPVDVMAAAVFSSANPDKTTTTLAWQQLTGASYDDVTDTQKSALKASGYTMYLPIRGVGILAEGKTADGNYADQRLTMDWFKVRGEQAIVQVLAAKAALDTKVPYTNKGLGVLDSVILNLGKRGEKIGHFEEETIEVVSVDADDIDDTTKASREYTITAGADFAGAVGSCSVIFRVTI